MAKLKIDRLVIVEGKYDKIKLSNLIDADIIAVGGFSLFTNDKLKQTLKSLAKLKGAIILTDSDTAGYKIRVYLNKLLVNCDVDNVLIPQIKGKERRKDTHSKEGYLGIEGIDNELLLSKLKQYSAKGERPKGDITVTDLFMLGFCGSDNSKQKKNELLKRLDVQSGISNNFMLKLINARFTREEFMRFVEKCEEENNV